MLQNIPKIGRLVKGMVKAVSERSVQLMGGESLQYDYLILATGSNYKGPEWEATEPDIEAQKAKHRVIPATMF
jgi:NADH dehydrogenase FAD-containing subunit